MLPFNACTSQISTVTEICTTTITRTDLQTISDIEIEPSPESFMYIFDESKLSDVMLNGDGEVYIGYSERDYFPTPNSNVKKGDPILVVIGEIRNKNKEDKYVIMHAVGYDVDGNRVADTLDAYFAEGFISLEVPYENLGNFVIHLNFAENIKTIRITAKTSYNQPP
jgi:hypothetical protein